MIEKLVFIFEIYDWSQKNFNVRSSVTKGVNAQEATTRACARVASNYPFAKLMEIAESVPTGRVRATSDKILNFYNFTRAL